MELEHATVFLTGGGGGIGRALSAAFASAGSRVVSADLKGADVQLDVTDIEAVAAAIAAVDRLDVVVANAGIGIGGAAEDIPPSEWQRTIDVNIAGVVNTVLPAYQRMRSQGHGSIVLMASLAGMVATPLMVPYSMSKHAIVGLGASLRLEAARHGIGVTTVCPGPVETPLLDERSNTPGLSARRFLVAAAGRPIAAEALAREVVAAVRTDRALVTPGRAALLTSAARLAPRLTSRVIASNMRKELRHVEG
jgi:NAD(P)-dependent dehydrogenase (short-subunit alcohol dehydrogenase family)